MTTTYDSKDEAFRAGAMYVGYSDAETITRVLEEAKVREEEISNPLVAMLGDDAESNVLKKKLTKKAEIRTITTVNGQTVELAVSKFRDGYDLFLIDPETEIGIRT